MENIRYGRLDATDEEVIQAAKTASAHSFIMRLPHGYQTRLEGDGARTERHIEHGMDRLMADRTTFVIAHRLSTVRNANAIMVLENGRIIERGDHDELLAMKGRYYELYTGLSELE